MGERTDPIQEQWEQQEARSCAEGPAGRSCPSVCTAGPRGLGTNKAGAWHPLVLHTGGAGRWRAGQGSEEEAGQEEGR